MSTEKIDITKVEKVIQDFSNKRIEVISREGFILWGSTYKNEQTFSKVFSKISKLFSEELQRRDGLNQSGLNN